MGDVVNGKFSVKKELVWECVGECGGQTFYLNMGGTVTCRVCGLRQRPPVAWLKDGMGLLGEIALSDDEEEPEE